MRSPVQSLVFVSLCLSGCSNSGSGVAPAPIGVPVQNDAGSNEDARASDSSVVQSECPAPERLTPEQLPKGYLAPANVTLVRTVDGDTAHFQFPDGEHNCRFLFVNTEESHGDETTDFGIQSATVVDGMLRAAKDIVVAVREHPTKPGQPNLDPYDRWLSLIFVDGELFQTRIIREGQSAYYTQFGCAEENLHAPLLYAEAEARSKQVGIWKPGHPRDYNAVLLQWIGSNHCRPNPFYEPYCKP